NKPSRAGAGGGAWQIAITGLAILKGLLGIRCCIPQKNFKKKIITNLKTK
ncbi:hypothetical protein LCGC14_2906950, partial [marine sediment metagenome]